MKEKEIKVLDKKIKMSIPMLDMGMTILSIYVIFDLIIWFCFYIFNTINLSSNMIWVFTRFYFSN